MPLHDPWHFSCQFTGDVETVSLLMRADQCYEVGPGVIWLDFIKVISRQPLEQPHVHSSNVSEECDARLCVWWVWCVFEVKCNEITM